MTPYLQHTMGNVIVSNNIMLQSARNEATHYEINLELERVWLVTKRGVEKRTLEGVLLAVVSVKNEEDALRKIEEDKVFLAQVIEKRLHSGEEVSDAARTDPGS